MSQSNQPPPPSAAAQFAGQLATMIVATTEERDALAREVAALRLQVADLQRNQNYAFGVTEGMGK